MRHVPAPYSYFSVGNGIDASQIQQLIETVLDQKGFDYVYSPADGSLIYELEGEGNLLAYYGHGKYWTPRGEVPADAFFLYIGLEKKIIDDLFQSVTDALSPEEKFLSA